MPQGSIRSFFAPRPASGARPQPTPAGDDHVDVCDLTADAIDDDGAPPSASRAGTTGEARRVTSLLDWLGEAQDDDAQDRADLASGRASAPSMGIRRPSRKRWSADMDEQARREHSEAQLSDRRVAGALCRP